GRCSDSAFPHGRREAIDTFGPGPPGAWPDLFPTCQRLRDTRAPRPRLHPRPESQTGCARAKRGAVRVCDALPPRNCGRVSRPFLLTGRERTLTVARHSLALMGASPI